MLSITDATWYLASEDWTAVKNISKKRAMKQRVFIIFTARRVPDWMRNSCKRSVKSAGGKA